MFHCADKSFNFSDVWRVSTPKILKEYFTQMLQFIGAGKIM